MKMTTLHIMHRCTLHTTARVWCLFALCTVFIAVESAAAQSSEEVKTGSINVTGRVVADLSGQSILIESIFDPSFVQENVDDTQIIIDPISNSAGAPGGAGLLIAKGIPNQTFQVVIPERITLTHSETNSTLQINVEVSHHSIDEQSSSDYVRDAIASFSLNEEGEYFFWIGGTLNMADVEEGNYEGSFLLEVEYI